jgi:hypothetical protein
MVAAGVEGVRVHMCGSMNQWLGELRAYIYAKLLWNPDYDVEAGIAEYCRHAYGPAAEPMLQYIRETQDPASYVSSYKELPGLHELPGKQAHVRPEALQRWQKMLAEAEKKAATDPASVRRVRIQRKPLDAYVKSREREP